MHPTSKNSSSLVPFVVTPIEVCWLKRPVSQKTARLALWLAAGAFAAAVLSTAAPADAQQDAPAATVGDSILAQQQFAGIATRDGVVVRSGASESDLAVATLSIGEEITVIHARKPYLRVLPPEGTFCLVPKARVNVRGAAGEAQVGRVTDSVTVRVGSNLSADIGDTGVRLHGGDEVRVLGEDGIYFKIEPPKMVFFYVAMSDLKKGRELRVSETPIGWLTAEAPQLAAGNEPESLDAGSNDGDPEPPVLADATPPETIAPPIDGDPTAMDETDPADAIVVPPAPEISAVVAAFTELDSYYELETQKPLEEQPLPELEKQYVELLASATEATDPAAKALVPVMEARLKTIAIRRSALDDLQAIRAMRMEVAERQTALQAESQELADRAEKGRITVYEAVGEILPSSLQVRGGTLFRLCDPETKRTIIYLRATDDEGTQQLAARLERFVGVIGNVVHDRGLDLKYVEVSNSAIVDPAAVFGAVAAKIIPPSMIAGASDEARQASAN